MGTPAAIWLRVSTGAQDESSQLPDCETWCERQGYDVVKTYAIHGKSAWHGKHDGDLDRMFSDMREGVFEVLVVWKQDRIERRGMSAALKLAERARDAGGRIEFATQPHLNKLSDLGSKVSYVVMAEVAEGESGIKSDRVNANFATIRRNGGVIGRAPFGYEIQGEKYAKTFAPTDDGRKYVPAIFERVIAGDSTRTIGAWLRSENVQTRQGSNVWSAWGIGHIIRCKTYMGLRVEEKTGRLVGRCEPLVDASTWEAANKALTEHAKPKGHARRNSALLTGILKCAKCGGPMYRTNIGRGDSAQLVYRCSADPKFGPERRSECANLVPVAQADLVMRRILTLAQAPVQERRRAHVPHQPSDRRVEINAEIDAIDKSDAAAMPRVIELMTELQSLTDVPDVPDSWEWVPTGEIWADVYARMSDDAELRAALIAKGVELHADSRTFPRRFGTRGLGDDIPAELASDFLSATLRPEYEAPQDFPRGAARRAK
jgi:DNA invertase Pin-like site-specific DNA recombinase